MLARRFILTHGYETSYTCLARRAAKQNNVWNRLVRRGSVARRVCVYGALQMVFTLLCTAVVVPTYFSWPLAVAFQVRVLAGAAAREGVAVSRAPNHAPGLPDPLAH